MFSADSRQADWLTMVALYARLALAASFLTAVADRLGLWGAHGTTNVFWGDMQHFQAYAGQLNPWFPASVIPLVSWSVTVAETTFALGLIAGFHIRHVSLLSGALLLAFAIGMSFGTGIHSALNASVFSACACALLLWQIEPDRLTLDYLIRTSGSRDILQRSSELRFGVSTSADSQASDMPLISR